MLCITQLLLASALFGFVSAEHEWDSAYQVWENSLQQCKDGGDDTGSYMPYLDGSPPVSLPEMAVADWAYGIREWIKVLELSGPCLPTNGSGEISRLHSLVDAAQSHPNTAAENVAKVTSDAYFLWAGVLFASGQGDQVVIPGYRKNSTLLEALQDAQSVMRDAFNQWTVNGNCREVNISQCGHKLDNSTLTTDDDQDISICGNIILEGLEECDDGNHANGDGCSSSCTLESCPSVVPTPSTPNGFFPDTQSTNTNPPAASDFFPDTQTGNPPSSFGNFFPDTTNPPTAATSSDFPPDTQTGNPSSPFGNFFPDTANPPTAATSSDFPPDTQTGNPSSPFGNFFPDTTNPPTAATSSDFPPDTQTGNPSSSFGNFFPDTANPATAATSSDFPPDTQTGNPSSSFGNFFPDTTNPPSAATSSDFPPDTQTGNSPSPFGNFFPDTTNPPTAATSSDFPLDTQTGNPPTPFDNFFPDTDTTNHPAATSSDLFPNTETGNHATTQFNNFFPSVQPFPTSPPWGVYSCPDNCYSENSLNTGTVRLTNFAIRGSQSSVDPFSIRAMHNGLAVIAQVMTTIRRVAPHESNRMAVERRLAEVALDALNPADTLRVHIEGASVWIRLTGACCKLSECCMFRSRLTWQPVRNWFNCLPINGTWFGTGDHSALGANIFGCIKTALATNFECHPSFYRTIYWYI